MLWILVVVLEVIVYSKGSTPLLWICRFNYDSTNIPPCVYYKTVSLYGDA